MPISEGRAFQAEGTSVKTLRQECAWLAWRTERRPVCGWNRVTEKGIDKARQVINRGLGCIGSCRSWKYSDITVNEVGSH